ncbi:hypothetical protein [Micromonospora sp. NPDC049679]|uniref:hypothetical protein n=1 Tax=Micromonospora sp. NPDC049679 TaxID=3155920 RepID=UPI0033DF52EB
MIYQDNMGSRLRRALLRVTVTLAITAGIIVAGSVAKAELAPVPDGIRTSEGTVR